jgi:hypothetical protein
MWSLGVNAYADTISPIIISNQNPMVAVHGLPAVNNAQVLSENKSRFSLFFDVSSHYGDDGNDNERILLDGETYRTTFIFETGVTQGFQFGLVIPYIKHKGGSLDHFINEWHDFFSFPEGGRDLAQNNQFQYRYVRDGEVQFNRTDSASGIGDVRLEGTWQLTGAGKDAFSAVSASVKLPTGDSDAFLGSGAADFALWYKHQHADRFWDFDTGVFYSAGALYVGEGDILPRQVNRLVGFGGFGAGVHLTDSLVFITQVDINSPFYSSTDLPELGDFAAQITVGGTIKGDVWRVNLGVAEDLMIDASADVTFHLDAQARF